MISQEMNQTNINLSRRNSYEIQSLFHWNRVILVKTIESLISFYTYVCILMMLCVHIGILSIPLVAITFFFLNAGVSL